MLILHLSDIHFRKSEISTAQDPNHHLRNELARDVIAQCKLLGAPDIIVLSGDIAFAGDPDEFAFATTWLRKLCNDVSGSLDTVFVCPGNHDVVRSIAGRNLVQVIHNQIKQTAKSQLDDFIAKQLADEDAARLLYESLENYNEFALQFFCNLLPPDRTRATRDEILNDGSVLRLWGLNTSFVSSAADKPGDLFVDRASFQITREPGVINLVAAHHHPSWLRQGAELQDHLNDVAQIQMFGHIHTNRIDLARDYVRLTASAMHPDRHEGEWEPGYNLVELQVEGGPKSRYLNIKTHVRVWQTAPGEFRAKQDKGKNAFVHRIELEDWAPPVEAEAAPSQRAVAEGKEIDDVATLPSGAVMDELRTIGLKFYQLSFSKKAEIAGRLDLLEEEDVRQPDHERFRRVFLRAHARGQLDELAAAIRAAEAE